MTFCFIFNVNKKVCLDHGGFTAEGVCLKATNTTLQLIFIHISRREEQIIVNKTEADTYLI